ncbi:MAG TPA: hypothetical protein PKN96_08195 [Flavobacterium sp.]|uniref:hypothetical protein n=1 Tax=Flavobacterium sp. TaxID=239 RepID=UPI002B978A22|nr:hypothetical protein [Flavobacterium sp.]HNP33258.1 hypothetical protein [Flavobacterium sp.]
MKKIFLLLFISTSAFSQSTESLKTATKKLYQANYLMDFDGVISLSYPKMVETIGSEKMPEQVEKYYENDEYRLRFQLETVPFQFGEIKKIEGKSFCVITCRNPMRYFFEAKLTSETSTQKAEWLKEINKTKEVTFEPNRNSFNVKKTTIFVAVADETTSNQWKFFNLDDANQAAAFQSIFGENIKKELGL